MANQNILLVDIGNSSAKWSLYNSANSTLAVMSQQRSPDNIDSTFFINCWKCLDKPEKVIVSCVASKKVWLALEQACNQLWAIQVEKVVSLQQGFGVINAYKQFNDLGSDRWCAMIGAGHEFESDIIVIDCGSAITIDVLSRSGNHLGGYILPGIAMMKRSLGLNTAEVKITKSDTRLTLTPSATTTDCVESAVYLAVVKLIEAVFKQQGSQSKGAQCVLTGGDAPLIAELVSMKYIMMPDLVLRGLAVIAESGSSNN